jgi:hypothetical protein
MLGPPERQRSSGLGLTSELHEGSSLIALSAASLEPFPVPTGRLAAIAIRIVAFRFGSLLVQRHQQEIEAIHRS